MNHQFIFKENPWFVNSMSLFLGAVVIFQTYSLLGWNKETIAFFAGIAFFTIPIYSWKVTQTIFDTHNERISWSQGSLFGKKKESLEFSDIKQIMLHSISGNRGRSYQVILKTKLGDFPLGIWYGHRDGAIKKKTKIENILTGNYDSDDPSENIYKNIDEEIKILIESGRKIDAITQLREAKGMTISEAKKYIDNLKD